MQPQRPPKKTHNNQPLSITAQHNRMWDGGYGRPQQALAQGD